MPLPIPEIIRQNVWFDAIGIGGVIGFGGWFLQGRYTSGRRARRHSRLTADLGRPERRKTLRATAAAGRSGQEQAATLAAAVDALVDFVDAPPTRARAAACADAIDRLVLPDERGTMTVEFLRLHASGAPPARMQRSAEEVCVQMAVELRAIVSRVQAEAASRPARPRPRPRRAPAPVARAVNEPAPAPAPKAAPRRAQWELEEERIFAAGRAAPPRRGAPAKVAAKRVAVKAVAVKPVAVKPVAAKLVARKPVAPKPVAPKPVAPKPVAVKPAAAKPASAKPVATKRAATKPVAAKPVVTKRATAKPPRSQPARSPKATTPKRSARR